MKQTVNLKPPNIYDLIDNINIYVNAMRKAEDIETIPKSLMLYTMAFFKNVKLNKELTQTLAMVLGDNTYRIIAELERSDEYTQVYFSTVIQFLWNNLVEKGVLTFYIIDNEMREDRFKLAVSLFVDAGAKVITPYNGKKILSFSKVEHAITASMTTGKNIVYIEKNASVNYLEEVIKIASNSIYFAYFRNKAVAISEVEILTRS